MTFTDEVWAETAGIRARIDALPFLVALEDGTLPRDRFDHYMAQDALYLVEFARVLAHAAARSSTTEELLFWSDGAANTIRGERALHERHVQDLEATTMSPTCRAYTSFLLSGCAGGSYGVIAASVLPCYWIYDDVGTRLKDRIGDLADHPYADWIGTYGDPAFVAATDRARGLVDDAARRAGPDELAAMRSAFTTAARYEHLFWDAAWHTEGWPV